MNNKNNIPFVSIIVIAENSSEQDILETLVNVNQQTYKNFEVLISSTNDFPSLREKANEFFLNNRWFIHQINDGTLLDQLVAETKGEIIFYRTVAGISFYPRHLQVHVEEFIHNQKAKWACSHLKYNNIHLKGHPLNTLGFRISNPPKVEEVILSEICHYKEAQITWKNCFVAKKEQPDQAFFIAGLALKQWNDVGYVGVIPNEITVQEEIDPNAGKQPNEQNIEKLIGVPKEVQIKEKADLTPDGEIKISRTFPTIVGNVHHEEYNKQIREVVKTTQDISSIAIKRTMGIGDVVLVEPIIKKLKQKYPIAKINFFTGRPQIVDYFVNKPDKVTKIEDSKLLEDFLYNQEEELKIDLDLAYESRLRTSFIDAYQQTVGVINFDDFRDKYPQLICQTDKEAFAKEHGENIIAICFDGSGWAGKTWSMQEMEKFIYYLLDKHPEYTVIETGVYHTNLTPEKYHKCEFKLMMEILANCVMFIGADNGPMHLSRSFKKPAIIFGGAALPWYTNPNREEVFYLQNNNAVGLGVKHDTFIRVQGEQISFVPHCAENPSCGLADIKAEHAIDCFEKMIKKEKCVVDDSDMKFLMNIPGWVYYKSNENDFIQRNDLNKHPDQETDISIQYENWQENYEKYAKPWVEMIVKYIPSNANQFIPSDKEKTKDINLSDIDFLNEEWKPIRQRKLLDIGASIGLTVKAAREMGYKATGIDLNEPSVRKSMELFPGENLVHLNTVESIIEAYEKTVKDLNATMENIGKYDIITFDQVIEHISDPISFLEKVKMLLENDGMIFIGTPRFDSKDGEEQFQKWGQVGTIGEHTFLFTKKSIDYLMNAAGLNYEELNDSYDYGGFILRAWKK